MLTKHKLGLLFALIAGILFFGSCQFELSPTDPDVADSPPAISVAIDSAHGARDAVMVYLRDHYGLAIPAAGSDWLEENITPAEVTSTTALRFSTDNWLMTILHPNLAPEAVIYTISVEDARTGFRWEGQIDANGTVTETLAQQSKPTQEIAAAHQTAEPEAIPPNTPTPTATSLADAAASLISYTDSTYRIAVEYPSNWNLSFQSAGSLTASGGFAAKAIQLSKDSYRIQIQYKFNWENTELGAEQPPGTVETRGTVTLLGHEIPQQIIVDQGKTILAFYGESIDDIAYHIRVESSTGELPDDIIVLAAQIVGSLQRTGEIFPSPTNTGTPTLTPTITPTPTTPATGGSTTSGGTKATATATATSGPPPPPTPKPPPTPIIVNAVAPNGDFAYDFAANACDATWVNQPMGDSGDPNQTLPCLGTLGDSKGFVTRVSNPAMEHRLDDELTLWVHPNEARYGYIQGTFPKYTVQAGDRFKTTIGCMRGYAACSIDFELWYKDAGGAIHNLLEWEEHYDEEAKIVNIDLSALAGQEVQFILKTIALTENSSAAQGFWFVPRIDD